MVDQKIPNPGNKKKPEAPKGRASIYKGTDKSTSSTKAKKTGNEVTYRVADNKPRLGQGTKFTTKTVKTSRGR